MIIYLDLHDGDVFIEMGLLAREVEAMRNGESVHWRKDLQGVGVHINLHLLGNKSVNDRKRDEEDKGKEQSGKGPSRI